ncbi:unnamed protein product [Boreogadus saida]
MAGTTEQADRKKPEDTGEPNELIGKGHPNKTNKETQGVWNYNGSRYIMERETYDLNNLTSGDTRKTGLHAGGGSSGASIEYRCQLIRPQAP